MIAVAALVLALVGCGKSKTTPASAQAATEPAAPPAAAGAGSVDHPRSATIRPLAQLLPWRTTHLTIDAAHHVYFVQESDEGNDIVFVAGPDDIAKPTLLTTNSILTATGGRDNPAPSQNAFGHKTLPAAGNVQSLLALADGRLLFFFGATAGRSARSCLGMFDPQNGSISVVANAQRLADVSQMGPTLELARGELIANRPGSAADQTDALPCLLLRHSDAWALLKLGKLPAAGPSDDVSLYLDHLTAAASPHPAAPTTAAVAPGDSGDEALPPAGPALPVMTNDAVHLAPAAQGFVALDLAGGAIWSIDQTGITRQIASLAGLSKTLSAPAMTADGYLVVMAADGPAFDRPDDADLDAVAHAAGGSSNLRYPAILRFSGQGKLTDTIGPDAMHGYPSLPPFRVQVASLAADGRGTSWVAYDVASGQLIRVYLQP
jgi:hypothetical protein